MKSKYILVLIVFLTGIAVNSCKDKESNVTPLTNPQISINPGDILTYSFVDNNDTMVKMQDEAIDFGTDTYPALIMVHKQTQIMQDGYENIFFPLNRDKLASFIEIWAGEFNMDFNTEMDTAMAYRDFITYYLNNDIDPGLMVELIIGEQTALHPVITMVTEAGNLKAAHGRNCPSANDMLYRLYHDEKLTPESLIAQYRPAQTKGEVIEIIGIVRDVVIIATDWIEFIVDNKAVKDFDANYASFLSSDDTIAADYTGGTAFQTSDYKLSYDVGLWQAKATYHLEGTYADTHPTIPGYYVASFNTIPTYVSCKGPDFIVEGETSYSPPANIGTFDVPVATYDGQVKVTYGDCCCFRKISYLDFRLNSQTGFQQISFSSGK